MTNGARVIVGGPAAPAAATAAAEAVVPVGLVAVDVAVNPRKGLWTLEEVIHLLRDCGLVVELSPEVPPAGWRAGP